MNKHIQIREVSDETHRALKARAAADGMSMSEYLKRMIERELKRPDWASMVRRMEAMEPIDIGGDELVQMVREERESR